MSAPKPRESLWMGRYRIERELGRGGMGRVDLALQTELERYVALKRIVPENVGVVSAEGWFRREYRALAAIRHPGVPAIHECGRCDDMVSYFTMEYIEGPSLRTALETRRFAAVEAISTAIELARILAAAHAVGVVHRDVKPANIILEAGGNVRLIDFGICFFLSSFHARAGNLRSVGQNDYQTGPMEVAAGTSGYSDPALAQGHPVSVQSDIFSVAVVLYEMLAGRRLFDDRTEKFSAIDSAEFPPELLPVVAELRRGSQLLPRDRHTSMNELVRGLEIARSAVLRARSRVRPRSAAVYLWLCLANLAVLATLGWLWSSGRLVVDGARAESVEPAAVVTRPAEPAPAVAPAVAPTIPLQAPPAEPAAKRPADRTRSTRPRTTAVQVSQAVVDRVAARNASRLRACLEKSGPLNLEIMVELGRARLTRLEWVPFDRRNPGSEAGSCLARVVESLEFPEGGPSGPYHVDVGQN